MRKILSLVAMAFAAPASAQTVAPFYSVPGVGISPATGVIVLNPDGTGGARTLAATGQVAVTTSATLVAAARATRQRIIISPTSSVVFYVGNAGVTSGTGVYVAAGASITLDTTSAVYAVGASNVTLSYVELY